ncbi:hypothetical protein Aperf_G00000124230 [Anoplocephala perfoliata]
MNTAPKLRLLAPPPPNRPLPPIPTAEEEKAAAACQRRSSPTLPTTKSNNSSTLTVTQKTLQPTGESASTHRLPFRRRSPSVLTATLNAQYQSRISPLMIQNFSTSLKAITIQQQPNRRLVPKMGTKSHPRGVQLSLGTCETTTEANNITCRISPQPSESSSHSSSSSSGCEDSTIDSRLRSSKDYMKITSQPCLFSTSSALQNQDSDDGYTSLNALDNHEQQNQKCLTKKKSLNSSSQCSNSISSPSASSSTSFDDESTLVCISHHESKDADMHPGDGMYRLKVKSTTSVVNSASQFHGNKRLVRKYRAKRRELATAETAPPKTVSLDRDHRKHIATTTKTAQPNSKEKAKQSARHSPCRLVTMLVV